ncbi:MAG: restriction endonuclease [Candidatus Omnitrophica bacterium]|nr:restriction endonuclease [Candidatus Omnitrophota bacterium]
MNQDKEKKKPLTLANLKRGASEFARSLSRRDLPELFGATDGKAVGTYVEHEFHRFLGETYRYEVGSAASGIDFPHIDVDMKVTSVRQPQSSCPYRSADQKVYGLGYHLLVLVYSKFDDPQRRIANLDFQHVVFVNKTHTGDYQTTRGILEILTRGGNRDDLVGYLEERNLPLDEIGRERLAKSILHTPPTQGLLTISNALQWRLQYGRVVELAEKGGTQGILNLLRDHT